MHNLQSRCVSQNMHPKSLDKLLNNSLDHSKVFLIQTAIPHSKPLFYNLKTTEQHHSQAVHDEVPTKAWIYHYVDAIITAVRTFHTCTFVVQLNRQVSVKLPVNAFGSQLILFAGGLNNAGGLSEYCIRPHQRLQLFICTW